jgi:lipopolysaccharide export system permease protein
MSILQKYVVREMLGPLGLGMGVCTFIFLVGRLFDLLNQLLNSGIPVWMAGEFILSLLPGIISITTPMAILVAILLGMGRLAADREILAIRMSGVNLIHICGPILVLSGSVALLMIVANQRLIPYLNLKSSDLGMQIGFKVLSSIPPNRFWELETSKDESSVFYYESRDPDTGDMRGVTVRTESAPQKGSSQPKAGPGGKGKAKDYTLILAQRGRIEPQISERLISMHLTTGSLHIVSPNEYVTARFESMSKGIRPALATSKSARELSVKELKALITEGAQVNRYTSEYYQRFSIPLACLAFALIAIPLAIYVRPTGKAIAFALSFLLILLYYGLLNYGISLGKTGSIMAPFAIFFPNLLLGAVGMLLLYRMVMK